VNEVAARFWVRVAAAIDWVAVTAGLTISVNVAELLDPKFVSPANWAIIEWLPTASAVVQVAIPLETGCAPQPGIVTLSRVNATVLSLTVLPLVTVAVKVSLWGKVAGLRLGLTTVVVAVCAATTAGTANTKANTSSHRRNERQKDIENPAPFLPKMPYGGIECKHPIARQPPVSKY
jgi:hypothetical protein